MDFGQSFAPVLRISSQCVLLAIPREHDWPVYQLDVQAAFLQSNIDGDVYVETAPGRDTPDNNGVPVEVKLKRALYGLFQSPALWYGTIDVSFLKVGFTPAKSDPCVCTHGHIKDNDFAVLTLYVGDILLTGIDSTALKKLKKVAVMAQYPMTDMGEGTMYSTKQQGITIRPSTATMTLSLPTATSTLLTSGTIEPSSQTSQPLTDEVQYTYCEKQGYWA